MINNSLFPFLLRICIFALPVYFLLLLGFHGDYLSYWCFQRTDLWILCSLFYFFKSQLLFSSIPSGESLRFILLLFISKSWANDLLHFLSFLRIFSLIRTRKHLHSQRPCSHLKNPMTKQSSAPPTSLVKWLGLLPEHQWGVVDRSMGDTRAATHKGLPPSWMMGSPYIEPPYPSLPNLTYPSPSLRSLGHEQGGSNCIQLVRRHVWIHRWGFHDLPTYASMKECQQSPCPAAMIVLSSHSWTHGDDSCLARRIVL